MILIHQLGFALLLLGAACGKDVTYEWDLATVIDNALSPDCMNVVAERRSMFLAEKSFPGPLIEADEGDTIKVRIVNHSPSLAASLHFHGIHQVGTPYSDGAAYVTQCALPPSQSQEYVFDAYPPGTHFWHDHMSYNMADGLSGPIIIHPKDPEPFKYDEEQIIFLQDWYISTGMQQYDGLISWPFVWVGNPNALLINGKGIAPECHVNGTNYNNSLLCLETCLGDPLDLLSTVNVTSGKTYRLRVINSGQLVMMNFAIAGHKMTIVQVEGTNVQPVEIESLDIAPGQRYDVLVTADQEPGSYLIETTVRERKIIGINGKAIFQYDDLAPIYPDEAPVHPEYDDTAFGNAQALSLKTINASSYPSASALTATEVTRYVLVGTQNQYIVDGVPQQLKWAVNNISNIHGNTPLIGRVLNRGWPADIDDSVDVPTTPPFVWNYTDLVNNTGGPGAPLGVLKESIIKANDGEVVEIVLQNARALNGAAEFHPWHLHGYSFWVVGQGEGIYDPEVDVASYNLVDPVLRDTVVLQALGWVAIRFVADNPGTWFFHCHIASHHVMGMALTIVVQPDVLSDAPPSVTSCSEHELVGTGTSSGNESAKEENTASDAIRPYPVTLFWISTVTVTFLSIMLQG